MVECFPGRRESRNKGPVVPWLARDEESIKPKSPRVSKGKHWKVSADKERMNLRKCWGLG